MVKDDPIYTYMDVFECNAALVCELGACVFLSHAFKWGKGGHVEAIQNTKTIVQTVCESIAKGVMPAG